MNLPLKNVQNTGGKYALFFMNGAGNWQRVEKIGMSVRPFQVVATFDSRPYIAVQKNGNVRNENDRRLYLINLRDGTVADGCQFGASKLTFDTNNKSIYFYPLASNGCSAQKYSLCLSRGGASHTVINVPSKLQSGIQSWSAKINLVPVIEIAVVDLVPRAKRKRGRPRGSKNKPKVLQPTTVVNNARTKPRVRKNMVSVRKSKRNSLASMYDVYINGRRVATRRMNANPKTFMNNRILVVPYRVSAGAGDYYDIFLPNGTQLYIDGTHRLTGMPITVNSVSENNGELKLGLSNRAVHVIGEQDLSRFEPAQFVLNKKQR